MRSQTPSACLSNDPGAIRNVHSPCRRTGVCRAPSVRARRVRAASVVQQFNLAMTSLNDPGRTNGTASAAEVDIAPPGGGHPRVRTEMLRPMFDGGRRLLALGLLGLLQACMVLPRTTQVYDPECQVVSNHMVLETVQVAAIHQCANQGCVALIVGAGIVSAASVVISGSIVIAGNVAYWFEKQSQCRKGPPWR